MAFFAKKQKFISLKEAAKLTGYASDYIGFLIRNGKIGGKKDCSGVSWMTTEEDLKKYQKQIVVQKKKVNSKLKITQFIYDIFPPGLIPEEVKDITKKLVGIKAYKTKMEKVFAFSWRFILLILIIFYFAGVGPTEIFNKIVGALSEEKNTVNLYSNLCIGDWLNPQNVQGQPDVEETGNLESFYESNSAVYRGGALNLICQNFENNSEGFNYDNSENFKIQSAKIKFSFAIGEKKPDLEIPQIPSGGSTPNESTPKTLPSPDLQLPPVETTPTENPPMENPLPTETLPIEIPPIENSPSEVTPSVTGLIKKIKNFFSIVTAQAQEEKYSTTEANDVLIPTDTKITIWYSLDNETWWQLGAISEQPTSNSLNGGYLSFDAPFLTSLEDLKNLKIKFEGVIGDGTNISAYLDSVWLDVNYVREKVETPEISETQSKEIKTIEINDKSLMIINLQNEFSSDEEPTFVITAPEINTDDIVSTGKGKILSGVTPKGSLGNDEKTITSGKNFLGTAEYSFSELTSDFNMLTKVKNQEGNVSVQVFGFDGQKAEILPEIQTILKDGKESFEIKFPKTSKNKFRPGLYKIKIGLETKDTIFLTEQDFRWGVLAINTNKSIFLPNENAYIQMAALKDDGHTICDANLELEIISPSGKIDNPEVEMSGDCGPDNVTEKPDYFVNYTTGEAGIYKMELTNLGNGYKTADYFEVKESMPFEIERLGPTRIYPPASYQIKFNITANEDFSGLIKELVPASFEIVSSDQNNIQTDNNVKIIEWQVDWKAGNNYQLSYQFDAPDISPYLYLLGPLEIGEFKEARFWQIAADYQSSWNTNCVGYASPQACYCSWTGGSCKASTCTATGGGSCPSRANASVVNACTQSRINNTCQGTIDECENWTCECSITGGTCNYTCTAGYVDCDLNTVNGCECNTGGGYTCDGTTCNAPAGITISGNAYEDEATTHWSGCNGSTSNISLIINGGTVATTTCADGTGAYSFTSQTVAAGQEVAVFMNATDKGIAATVVKDASTGPVILNPIKGRVWVKEETSAPSNITNTLLHKSDKAVTNCSNVPYTISDVTNALTIDDTYKLVIETGKTFAPDGAVTTPAMEVLGTYTASSYILTLSAAGSGATCTADAGTVMPLCINGGTFSYDTSTVIYNNDGTVTIAATTYYKLTLSPTITVDRTYTGAGAITINNNFTIYPASSVLANFYFVLGNTTAVSGATSVDCNGDLCVGSLDTNNDFNYSLSLNNITAGTHGYLWGRGSTITVTGSGSPFAVSNGTWSYGTSTVIYTGSSATNIQGINYYNLNLGGAATTTTYTAAGNIGVSSVLTIVSSSGANTFDASTRTITLAGTGTPFVIGTNGVFTYSTSKIVYSGATDATNITSTTYYDLDLGGTSATTTYTAAGDITVTHVLTIVSSAYQNIFNASSRTITLSGTGTPFVINSEVFTYSTSTIVYTGATTATNVTSTTYYNLNLGGAATTTTYTAAGDITVTNVLTIVTSSGTNTFDASSRTITLSGTGTPFVISASEIFTPSNSTVVYNNNGTVTVAAATYYNLNLTPSVDAARVYTAAGAITVNHDLNVTPGSANTQTMHFDLAGTTSVGGTTTVNCTGPSSLCIGYLDTNSNSFTSTNIVIGGLGYFYANGSTITVTGSGSPFTGTGLGVFNKGTSTVKYIGTSATNIGGSDNIKYYNLNLGDSGTTTTYTASDWINVYNVLTIVSSSGANTFNASNKTITLLGNGATPFVIGTNGVFTASTSTIVYAGQVSPVNVTSTTYYNLNIGGSATTVTYNAAGDITVSNILTIVSSSSTNTFNASSYTITLSGTGTPFVISASEVFTPSTSTIIYSGATTATNVTSTTYYNLNLGGSGTTTTYTAAGDITVTNVLTIVSSSGTNTFDASSRTITLSGTGTPFVINATEVFTPSDSTVKYTGDGATNITAATYYDLTFTPPLTTDRTYTALGAITVNHNLTQNPSSAVGLNTLRFDLAGTTIVSGTLTITYTTNGADKFYTNNNTLTAGAIAMGNYAGYFYAGSSTITITNSGTVLTLGSLNSWDMGTSTVIYTGSSATNITATSSYFIYYNLNIGGSDTTTTYTAAGNITVSHILTIVSSSGTNTFDASSRTITLSGTGTPFVISASEVFTPSTSTVIYSGATTATNVTSTTYYNLNLGGAATTTTYTAAGDITVSNVLTIVSSSGTNTFDASSRTITLSGTTGTPFVNNETFTHSTSTVQYTGANAGGNTNVVATDYYNLILNAADIFDAAGNIEVSNVFTIQHASAVFDAKATTLTLSGSGTPFVKTGTFTPSTSKVVYKGSSATNISTTYYDLDIGGPDTTTTYTAAEDITVTNVLTIVSSSGTNTFDASSRTITLSGTTGTPFVINVSEVFTPSTSIIKYTGNCVSSCNTNVVSTTYYNLYLDNGSETFDAAGDITVSNVFTINSGTFDAKATTLTLSGSGTPFVKTGTFTPSTSKVKYTAGGGSLGLAGWSYRKSHVINSATSAGTNYQVAIKVYKTTGTDGTESYNGLTIGKVYVGTNVRDDFGDIRFTDSGGSALLDYWMEELTSGTSAVFWVEVTASLESAPQTIYVYYGKSDATTTSSGTNTFLFFDDFNGAAPDPSVWTVGGSPTCSGGILSLTQNTSIITKTATFGAAGAAVRWKGASGSYLDDNQVELMGFNDAAFVGSNYVHFNCDRDEGFRKRTSKAGTSTIGNVIVPSNTNNYIWEVDWLTASSRYSIGTTTGTLGDATNTPIVALPIGFWERNISAHTTTIEWTLVRKYVTSGSEPAHSTWGGEEGATAATYITATTYNNLELFPAVDGVTLTLGTAGSQTINTNGYLTIGDGTHTGTITADTYDPILNVDGTFTISASGTFIASNSGTFTIAGNFSNSGNFTHSSGTITFDGAAQQTLSGTMTGASAFYNLIITNNTGTDPDTDPSLIFSASAAADTATFTTASTKVRFTASSTYTFTNINFNGQAVGTRLALHSSSSGTPWNLVVTGIQTVSYTNPKDSNACGGNNIDPGTGSLDGGNNSCWNFNLAPSITSVSDSSDPQQGGSNVSFDSVASDADIGDTIKLYICKAADCANCGPSDTSNCWAVTATGVATNPSASYACPSCTAATNNHWAKACDNNNACSPIIVGGSFSCLKENACLEATSANCFSTFSTDGYCCNSSCSGTCQRCDATPGACTTRLAGDNVECYGGYRCDGTNTSCVSSGNMGGGSSGGNTGGSIAYPIIEIPKIIQEISDEILKMGQKALELGQKIAQLFKPKPQIPSPPLPPVSIPELPQLVFQGKWQLLSSEPIREFVLSPLPTEIQTLTEKFPELEKTLSELDISKMTDVKKLENVGLTLPGITKRVGFILPFGIPIAKLSTEAKEKIPTNIIFCKTGGEKIDFDITLTVDEEGKPEQKIRTISGQPLSCIIKPDNPVETIKGYLVFRSRNVSLDSSRLSLASMIDALFFADPTFAFSTDKPVDVEEKLVLMEFEYTDPDGDGIYTAEIKAPIVDGEYEILSFMNYKDPNLGMKEIKLITAVDPEGYIFEKYQGKELRISGAKVSLYWLNPETKEYELWKAGEFLQNNPQITNSTGNYSFLVPQGSYYLKIEAQNYKTYQGDSFEVQEGSGVHFNIELKSRYWWLKIFDWKAFLLILIIILLFYNFYRDKIREKLINRKYE